MFAVSATTEKNPNAVVLRLKKGDKIPCPHDDDTVYRVHDGVVGLHVITDDGHAALLSILGAGSYFGDRRRPGSRARDASVTALTPATILRMERRSFLDYLAADPTALEAYISCLAERSLEYETDLCGHLFDTSEQRLHRLLLKLCRLGVNTGGAVELPVRLTHDMLAQMVGTTRSRVTFFMNKFRRQGWVVYGRSLVIHPNNAPAISNTPR